MADKMRAYSNNSKLVEVRRKHIAMCAARLFAKKSYDRTNVQEIADACGMAVGALYRYIGKKDDILDLVLDYGSSPFHKLCDELDATLDAITPDKALRMAIEKYYCMIDELQDVIRMGYQEIRLLSPNIRQVMLDGDIRFVNIFEKALNRGREAGVFRTPNTHYLAHSIVVLGAMWAIRKWYLGKRYTLDEYINMTIELVLNATTGDNGQRTELYSYSRFPFE